MRILRPNPRRAEFPWRALMGVASVAFVVTVAPCAGAQPKGDHGPKEHPRAAAAAQAEEHAERGHGKPDHPNMREAHEHEHDDARDAGAARGPRDAIRLRLEELEKKGDKLTPEEHQELAKLRANRHRTPWAARRARYADLKARQDAGTLSAAEQGELQQLQIFENRRASLESTDKVNDDSRQKRAREAKRAALRENPNVGKDPATTAEFKKHAERMAKLERAAAIASTETDDELLKKINELIGKEQQRHGAWLQKHAAQGGTP